MKTAIRLDDITPDMDWGKYNRIEKILNTYSIKPLIGVVPFNKDDNLHRCDNPLSEEEFVLFLNKKKEDHWVIALHGYNHVYTTSKLGIFPLNNFSEYAGVSFDKQREMLTKGRERLKEMGFDTDFFMTPAHTYDKNTLKALKSAGFKRVTDGFGSRPYIRAGLIFYPISRKRTECVSEKSGYTTLVLHTNTMEDKDIDNFERLIRDNREHFINYEDYLELEPVKRGVVGNCIEYLTAISKYMIVKLL